MVFTESLMKKKWTKAIKTREPINERIITLHLKICGRTIIIGLYGPTEDIKVIKDEKL